MKRTLFFIALLVAFFSTVGAITTVSPSRTNAGWIVDGTSADLSGCESLVAAVSGKSIVIDYLIINTDTALNVTIGEGETTSAVTTVKSGPWYLPANGAIIVPMPPGGLKLTAATALTVDASAAGNVTIFGWGRYQ